MKMVECNSFIMNEANLSTVEKARLAHWRQAHRQCGEGIIHENCPICEEGKRKTKGYKRNVEYRELVTQEFPPFHRLYADGYGGQRSLGEESYQGAKGGFVFVCPSTGTIKVKLYATSEQFPAILYQVLQEIEAEGYACREIYVDTFKVNFSAAAEEVAAMFRVRLVPVSSGTPQEMAYAESAVRVIGEMARSLMAGAPHLDESCWGLADVQAAYVHDLLPQQSKQNMSPYERRKFRVPDLDVLFLRVFGCPAQYEPYGGALHKRGKKTEWGYFVGVQWPMALILRPEDGKIISVSRKKILCHEEIYATFDSSKGMTPATSVENFKLNLDNVKGEVEGLSKISEFKTIYNIPDHVLSIKFLDDYKRNQEFNNPEPTNPPRKIVEAISPQSTAQGENPVEIINVMNADLLMEEIGRVKANLKTMDAQDDKATAILRALKKLEEELTNEAPRKKGLKRKSKPDKGKVDAANIIDAERTTTIKWQLPDYDETVPEPPGKRLMKRKVSRIREKGEAANISVGDEVKILSTRFGAAYAKGRDKFIHGQVMGIKGKIYEVLWKGDTETMKSHVTHLKRMIKEADSAAPVVVMLLEEKIVEIERDIKMEDVRRKIEGWFKTSTAIMCVLPILEVHAQIHGAVQNDEPGNWPKDFLQAMMKDDWREWISAIKKEIESWHLFDAADEVAYEDMVQGATIIPLGELFTRKRCGKYKFRQIAMGNMLKKGRDYGETFSSTISGDGIRWFFSLAVSCGKVVKGWDATTGYLQSEQRVPIYAYLPSHHGFADLEFEELGTLRLHLMQVLKEQGGQGIRDLAKQMKLDRRDRPKTVLKLNKSVYGIPDAGQAFSMFIQGLHKQKCGLLQSEMDPCIFYKITQDEKRNTVKGYLIAITWVDDCRYFGTADLVAEYEKVLLENCKCTLEGVAKEFVSIQIRHDMEARTLELTQEDYWVKAVERFKEFLPRAGPKERLVPLSPADERLLVEPSEEEMAEASHLPYTSLLGVCQYQSAYTRLEMRYAMSILSRFRTKWGKKHFEILVKTLEYGYATRKMGLKYDGNQAGDKTNVLEGYADSSLSLPRSQGCRTVVMNNAAVSFTSKRHTTTDDSTAAAELTEQYLCACDVEGYRNLMQEIGLMQDGPTVIWQDNQAAIQIAMNRGALAKKTRAMEMRVMTIRNKIEDMKVVPMYLRTSEMIADIGTKALDPKLFVYLRYKLCGYWKE